MCCRCRVGCVELFDAATQDTPFLYFVWGRLFHVNLVLHNTGDALQFVNLLRLTALDVPKACDDVCGPSPTAAQPVLMYYHKHAQAVDVAGYPLPHYVLGLQYQAEKTAVAHFDTYQREPEHVIAQQPSIFRTPAVLDFETGKTSSSSKIIT